MCLLGPHHEEHNEDESEGPNSELTLKNQKRGPCPDRIVV